MSNDKSKKIAINDFRDVFVKLDIIEETGLYGHFPFQLLAQNHEGKKAINALAVGDVKQCYDRFAYYLIKDNAERIFMSVDFPAMGEIKNDFIMVFSYYDGALYSEALPYDPKTGKTFPTIFNSPVLLQIKEQLQYYIKTNYGRNL